MQHTAYQKGACLEVTISDRAEDNRCFARLPDGCCLFVSGLVTIGDTVEVEIVKVKKNYLEAQAKRVLQPSPLRVEPHCSHFGICGGCKWQHLAYSAQLEQKRKQVKDALEHIGGFCNPNVLPAIGATEHFGYRNKVEFSFSNQRFLLESERETTALEKPLDFALGFHAPNRFDKVVDIDECHIAAPEMNQALRVVKAFAQQSMLPAYSIKTNEGFWRHLVVRKAFRTGEVMVNVVTSWYEPTAMTELASALQRELGSCLTSVVNNLTTRRSGVSMGEEEKLIWGKSCITEQLGNLRFNISANSFFQTNTVQAERLYELVRVFAHLEPSDIVYDLYCGTGSISLFVAPHCKKVLGIELVESAIKDAEENARLNAIENASFRRLDLKDFRRIVPELHAFGRPDVVITDPPRAGMHPDAIQTLLQLAPRRVVYVSCNPASLARDGKRLCEKGLYRLCEIQPIDMFPQTNHIESIACFERQH
ncbi:MAG: 23S rRNA (uracil(1939)-C(5))-methyltransferase RlmD [Chloroherpetonaceae bacterium]|nr:23S rRNA (uracil(1939)-C(5))-methyltransferase RlmD [Chloroherpetonaceae bacterium]MCS7210651.1 23S rRNA (uracil(1939)-C(5))-methyltransferase RlmD [Chloroherpetonaceae bacterium]MDW8020916.1 23S rRNA (uracil(1939)-C(5))-methyltransferase RlmD [Chloroherpetonaceae bacterium]MDW8464823.1 23S rRNA (uracil(1939)-C(5))-methyltransferase RlmD [Chloroherpetonaceae bacterium]